jgi:integrase/recombinase XerC
LLDSGITASSVNRKITTLKSYFKFLIQEDIVSENPTRKIISPKKSKKIAVFEEKSKMDSLLSEIEFPDSFEGERDKLIIDVFYMTGVRLSELLSLKINDIDQPNQTIKVLGKRNKERIIPLSINLLNDILNFSEKHKGNNYIFVNFEGKNLSSKKVYIIVNKCLSMVSSIEKKSPHVMRHTFATHMLNNGADLNVIKELLGHASLSATEVYTHNSIDKLKEIFNNAHPRA